MIISTDLGLTGYIAFCEVNDGFRVLRTEKIIIQSKNHKLDIKKETTAIIKNQVDFSANYNLIMDYIEKSEEHHIGLFEQITTRPINSAVSSMSLSDSSAVFRCVFEALDIDYRIIPPKNWKSLLGLTSDKKQSQELFYKLVESKKIILCFKKNIRNHNEIESILIAYYYYCINKKAS